MNSKWLLSLALGAGCVATAFADPAKAPKIPLEDFCHGLAVAHAIMSPDGKAVAYEAMFEKDATVVFMDLDARKTNAVEIPYANSPLQVGLGNYFLWLGPKRAAFSPYNGSLAAIDYDGSNYVGLSGEARQQNLNTDRHSFYAPTVIHSAMEDEVLLNQYDFPVNAYSGQFVWLPYPNVVRVNTRIGGYGRELENPGNVTTWIADSAGVVRVGVQTEKGLNRVIYRESDSDGWHVPLGLDYNGPRTLVLGLSGDAKTLYVGRITPERKWGVYAYDLVKQRLGDLILAHNHYDIIPPDYHVSHDGISMQSLVFSRVRRDLLGVRFVTNQPRTFWLDPTLRAVQDAVDQALPKRINTITSFSDDLGKMVILSWTARDPGTYYIFDSTKKTLKELFTRAPWFKPAQMAEVYPISYKARDGLVIEGYLTVPVGHEPKHLPLIVYPHGGPWVRDSLEFDMMTQFLANRGYAVLQVNYRGSNGYGDDFFQKGKRQIGRKIQDDIADGTRWAIDQGIADPARIAIMGGSYGGYSTLMGLMQTPELYRCGIDIAGVTDWVSLIKYDQENIPLGSHFIRTNIGDPEKDAAELHAVSPVELVDKIRAPLLIVHGKDDPTVPYEQATALMAALDRAHKPYEVLAKQNELHGFHGYKDVVLLFTRIEQFLATNMPADASPAVAVAGTH